MEAHEKGFFTEEDSVEVVIGRNARAKDQRLKEAMAVIVRKLGYLGQTEEYRFASEAGEFHHLVGTRGTPFDPKHGVHMGD